MRFAYRLARDVGRTDVRVMLREMQMWEFEWWKAYYTLEPSLDQRIDWLIASVTQMLYNIAADKNHQKPLRDFLLKFEEQTEKAANKSTQTWQMQKQLLLMYFNEQVESKSARITP